MKTLRQTGQFSLNIDQQVGLYNITNSILVKYTKKSGVSFWFDKETADSLCILSDYDFIHKCYELAGNDIYSLEVFRNMWDEFLNLRFDEKNRLIEDYRNPFRSFYIGETKNEIKEFFKITFKVNF
jgi:hypothetical protein